MSNEYIVINKTELLKRIEELEKVILLCKPEQQLIKDLLEQELFIRKQILSQSTPLIPEIEKAYNQGYTSCEEGEEQLSKDYISNLKLDI